MSSQSDSAPHRALYYRLTSGTILSNPLALIPFSGALNVQLWKLPYVLPLAAIVAPYRWSPDSFAVVSGTPGPDIVYRLRPRNFTQYSVLNSARVFDQLGAPYHQNGIDYSQVDPGNGIPQFALYSLLNAGNVVLNFQDVVAVGGPGVGNWLGAPNGSAFPVVAQGKIAYWFSATDIVPQPWNALIFPGLVQGWFGPSIPYNFGQAFWQDVKNNRTLGLDQPAFDANQQIVTFDALGNITSSTNITTGGTGFVWLDGPQYSAPWCLPSNLPPLPGQSIYAPAWMLVGDNTNGYTPQVPNGSPLFVIAPDFSAYYEIVFGSFDPAVQKNTLGGYGPPANYSSSGLPLVTSDLLGNLYYLQLDSSASFLNVYSSFNPAGVPTQLNPFASPNTVLPFCVQKPKCVAGMRYRDLV
jgi:hypothetical protein